MIEYAILKLVHLGALIFWLGPPIGAWLVFKYVNFDTSPANPVAAKVSRVFFFTVILEHIAFVFLLATGFTLAYRYQMFGAEWLNQKLYLLFLIILPLEIADVYLGNWVAARASAKLGRGENLKPWEAKCLVFYHGFFTKLALVLIPLSVLAIMYLAVSKTGLF